MRAISSWPGKRASRGGDYRSPATGIRHPVARLLAAEWPYSPRVLDLAWGVFSAVNLIAIYWFANWETIPFHFIWISLTLLYGFRPWRAGPTVWVLTAVMLTTSSGIGLDVYRGSEPLQELTEVPLMAAVFAAMAWSAHRKQKAEWSHHVISEQNLRLLADQRRFLQDAAHQLKTPITIALGHAELLADGLARSGARQEGEDIEVVIDELSRLRRISERLLILAAAADPAFLHPEPVALDRLIAGLIRRWRPAADRCWQIGQLDQVTVRADRERLGLALDALLENAVRHTGSGDVIQLSVIRDYPGMPARIIVADTGGGIAADRLPLIFDRFATGDDEQPRRTGLGLPLVRAVADAHGGNVTVRSEPGNGSEFELTLPAVSGAGLALTAGTDHASAVMAGKGTVIADEDAGEDIADRGQQRSARR